MAEDSLKYFMSDKGGLAKDANGQIKHVFLHQAAFYGGIPSTVTNRDRIQQHRNVDTGTGPVQLLDSPGVERYMPPFTLKCLDDCPECTHQYRSMCGQTTDVFAYASEITDTEARNKVAACTDSSREDLAYLRSKVPAYGGALLGRWKKKSSTERRKLLLSAMPDMYPKNWAVPNLDYEGVDWVDKDKDRNAWLLPYLNLEALCNEPMRLLALVHYRTSYEPFDWVLYDNKQVEKPFMRGAVGIEFNPKAVCITRDGYGTLMAWDKSAAHRWTSVGVPRALLVFEAQRTLYGFLRLMVSAILEGAQCCGKVEMWEELAFKGFKVEQHQHHGSLYLDAPFSAPPAFDIKKLVEIAQCRLHAAEDQLELLQTDPAYVQHILDERTTTVLSKKGAEIRSTWDIITKDLMTMAYHKVRQWELMLDECDALEKTLDAHKSSITSDTMSNECDIAFDCLDGWVWTCESRHVKELHAMLCDLRLFQDQFRYDLMPDGEIYCTPDMKGHIGKLFYETPLMWAASMHVGSLQVRARNAYDPMLVNGFIVDRIEKASREDRRKVDRRFFDHITEMAAVHEIRDIVSYHPTKPLHLLENKADMERAALNRLAWRTATIDTFYSGGGYISTVRTFGPLLKGFYGVKWPKGKKDSRWLEQANKSRNALNAFWKDFRAYTRDVLSRQVVSEQEAQHEMARISITTTQKHVLLLLEERKAILEHEAGAKQKLSVESSLLSLQPEPTEKPKLEIPLHLAQPKKRRQAISSSFDDEKIRVKNQPAPQRDGLEEVGHSIPKIAVSRDSLSVFARMFPSRFGAVEKQALRWSSLVAALVDAGCSAEPSDGSAVTFRRDPTAGGGAIVIHRPHPEPNVDPIMLHAMGKRIEKWFRWNMETFQEREKGGR